MNSSNNRLCKECNQPILYGRKDRKFCSAECKSAYHNKNYQIKFRNKAIHEKIIQNNYHILKSFFKEGKTVIRKSSFDELNFEFNYFTTIYRSKKSIYFFVYDIGYAPIIDHNGIRKLLIVEYQDYMKTYRFDAWRNIK
ncbi:hypothetical protein [Flammeovirga sp. SubArs3]|uniref:hypothetical protein n=1 Tax=Flammeovirga sp. SubArs3 TaxID=2995316 RepID=UPI00248BB32D|nr:hypothetical protein [Flammeovirga sp. SubArs3]